MKPQEFKKLILEEVRKVLKEDVPGTLRNVKVDMNIFSGDTYSEKKRLMNTFFGKFITIKQGPNKEGDAVVDLHVDSLLSLLEKNAKYSAQREFDWIAVYFGEYDSINMDLSELPANVANAILLAGKREQAPTYSVAVQIGSNPYSNFDDFESYSVPEVAKKMIGMPNITASPGTATEEKQIDQYVRKLEKALLAAAKKVVPGIKSMAIEDGDIIFELPGKPDTQMKSKLKSLFKGAKKVTFQ